MDVGNLLPIGITLIVVTLALAFGAQVLGETRDDIGVDSCAANTNSFTLYNSTTSTCMNTSNTSQTSAVGTAEFNGSVDGLTGLTKLTGKLPTIGLVIAAVVVIAILVRGFSKAA